MANTDQLRDFFCCANAKRPQSYFRSDSTKIDDKRDDFDFEIVNFRFFDGDVPRSTSYGFYITQLIRFARAYSYVTDFKMNC